MTNVEKIQIAEAKVAEMQDAHAGRCGRRVLAARIISRLVVKGSMTTGVCWYAQRPDGLHGR